jgi:hypothetical protein
MTPITQYGSCNLQHYQAERSICLKLHTFKHKVALLKNDTILSRFFLVTGVLLLIMFSIFDFFCES